MLDALKRWRHRRVLERAALPDALWSEALSSLPFLAQYDGEELARLRDLCVLFLDRKSIVGAGGHDVTPLQRVVIAIPARRTTTSARASTATRTPRSIRTRPTARPSSSRSSRKCSSRRLRRCATTTLTSTASSRRSTGRTRRRGRADSAAPRGQVPAEQ